MNYMYLHLQPLKIPMRTVLKYGLNLCLSLPNSVYLQSPESSTVSTEVKVHKPTFSKYHLYDVTHEKFF